MSPTITLTDETFSKLQALARPFIDTPESVISALAESELERRAASGNANDRGRTRDEQVLQLNPDSHEDLTHTRILSATVDGHPIHRPKWNGVLDHLHIIARERMGSFETVRRASGANIREGRYEESGYRYLPEANLSIQGVDANLAWDHSLGLARALQIPIHLRIEWRQKDGAKRPGEEAILKDCGQNNFPVSRSRRRRHCERSEAIFAGKEIASSLPAPRHDKPLHLPMKSGSY